MTFYCWNVLYLDATKKLEDKMSEDLYTELRRLSPKVTGGLIWMREETFRDASVPAKYKILAALVAVVVIKCEPCIRGYTKMAFHKGVTQDELIEFLNVAITEGGCPGETWALKALQAYRELEQGKEIEEELCCHYEDVEWKMRKRWYT